MRLEVKSTKKNEREYPYIGEFKDGTLVMFSEEDRGAVSSWQYSWRWSY